MNDRILTYGNLLDIENGELGDVASVTIFVSSKALWTSESEKVAILSKSSCSNSSYEPLLKY